jgi:hypothetical protein
MMVDADPPALSPSCSIPTALGGERLFNGEYCTVIWRFCSESDKFY